MIPADIRRGAMCELARRDFFFYCKLKAPDFYTDDRKFFCFVYKLGIVIVDMTKYEM